MIGDMYEDADLYKGILSAPLSRFIVISKGQCLMLSWNHIYIQDVAPRLTIFKKCWVNIT